MNINDCIHAFAGTVILVSLALGHWVNPYWYLLTAFVGANLLQFAFSKFCPLGWILKKLGVPEQRPGNKACCC